GQKMPGNGEIQHRCAPKIVRTIKNQINASTRANIPQLRSGLKSRICLIYLIQNIPRHHGCLLPGGRDAADHSGGIPQRNIIIRCRSRTTAAAGAFRRNDQLATSGNFRQRQWKSPRGAPPGSPDNGSGHAA
ncbi:MAG: hypothetical protein PHP86_18670, partial [Nevskiales bacterium]|nr:hypothetical protein [Nevskiales bacterium]